MSQENYSNSALFSIDAGTFSLINNTLKKELKNNPQFDIKSHQSNFNAFFKALCELFPNSLSAPYYVLAELISAIIKSEFDVAELEEWQEYQKNKSDNLITIDNKIIAIIKAHIDNVGRTLNLVTPKDIKQTIMLLRKHATDLDSLGSNAYTIAKAAEDKVKEQLQIKTKFCEIALNIAKIIKENYPEIDIAVFIECVSELLSLTFKSEEAFHHTSNAERVYFLSSKNRSVKIVLEKLRETVKTSSSVLMAKEGKKIEVMKPPSDEVETKNDAVITPIVSIEKDLHKLYKLVSGCEPSTQLVCMESAIENIRNYSFTESEVTMYETSNTINSSQTTNSSRNFNDDTTQTQFCSLVQRIIENLKENFSSLPHDEALSSALFMLLSSGDMDYLLAHLVSYGADYEICNMYIQDIIGPQLATLNELTKDLSPDLIQSALKIGNVSNNSSSQTSFTTASSTIIRTTEVIAQQEHTEQFNQFVSLTEKLFKNIEKCYPYTNINACLYDTHRLLSTLLQKNDKQFLESFIKKFGSFEVDGKSMDIETISLMEQFETLTKNLSEEQKEYYVETAYKILKTKTIDSKEIAKNLEKINWDFFKTQTEVSLSSSAPSANTSQTNPNSYGPSSGL